MAWRDITKGFSRRVSVFFHYQGFLRRLYIRTLLLLIENNFYPARRGASVRLAHVTAGKIKRKARLIIPAHVYIPIYTYVHIARIYVFRKPPRHLCPITRPAEYPQNRIKLGDLLGIT